MRKEAEELGLEIGEYMRILEENSEIEKKRTLVPMLAQSLQRHIVQ